MNLSMTKERSDSLMKTGIFSVTSIVAADSPDFVRKLNKDGTQFDLQRTSGWSELAEQRTGSYGQN